METKWQISQPKMEPLSYRKVTVYYQLAKFLINLTVQGRAFQEVDDKPWSVLVDNALSTAN